MSGTSRAAGSSIGRLLSLLSAGTAAVLVVVYVVGSVTLDTAFSEVERGAVERRAERTQMDLAERAATRRAVAREYAWWDDTWEYVDRPAGPAASQFIQENFVGWLPRQYGDRVIAIWSKGRRLLFGWSDSSVAGVESEFETPEFFNLLDRRKSVGGFVRTSRGLFVVGAAVVARTEDMTGEGPNNGYVMMGYPAGDSVVAAIGRSLQEQLSILTFDTAITMDTALTTVLSGGDSLETRLVIRDVFGAPVALARLTASRQFLNDLSRWTDTVFGLAFLLGGLALGLAWLVARRTVVRPLGAIASELKGMEAAGRFTAIASAPPTQEWGLFVAAFNETVEALRVSEGRYRSLFDSAADALFLLDDQGRIVEANASAARLAGDAQSSLAGRSLADQFEPALPGTTDPRATYQFRRQDGSTVAVGLLHSAVTIGTAQHSLAAMRDLSERETLQAQLRQAQKMEALGTLAGGIAHDFNNLMGAVLVSSATLKEELGPAHGSRPAVDTIERASRRAAELTRQLLSFARRKRLLVAPINLVDVVRDIGRMCARTFDRAIRVETIAPQEVVLVNGDSGQLEQALLNLCINSRDAMPSGGVLTLEVRVKDVDQAAAHTIPLENAGLYALVSVSDTGVGISPAAQQRLFEPFFTTKEQGKGTGLGLAMVYGILKSHGGVVAVSSMPAGGTRFDLYFPVVGEGAVPAALPASAVASPGGSETILLIDDEADLRCAMARALKRLGYQVLEAENGRVGVEMLREHRDAVGMVILDLIMPEMGGVEAFGKLRELRPDLPVLLCSGYASAGEVQVLLDQGANGFLPKPFESADLARDVRQVLDAAARVPAGSSSSKIES